MCGTIAGYNDEPIPMKYPQVILRSRLKVQGFIVTEHMEVWPQAIKELSTMVAAGTLKYRESISHGLESAPQAFIGLLKGQNFGKQLVKLV
jgi:NADPH-dependent curcumin reductase CurA